MTAGDETGTGLRVPGAGGYDATHYPLMLAVVPGERLRIRLDYQPHLFDQAAAEQITARLVRVLEAVAADPGQPVSAVEVLDPDERRQVLAGVERHGPAGARRGRCRGCSRPGRRPTRRRSRWSSKTPRLPTGS